MSRINKQNISRGVSYLKRNGLKNCYYKVSERLVRDKSEEDYTEKVLARRPKEEELLEQKKRTFDNDYKISILVPLYETEESLMIETIESIARQSYGNWELCIADASKDDKRLFIIRDYINSNNLKYADSYGRLTDKIKYRYLDMNQGISGNTNEALKMATGDFVALLDHDDLIEPDTLYVYMDAIEKAETTNINGEVVLKKIKIVYCDEDKITYDGKRYFDHHIKPDFDEILLCTNNYICHFLMVDTALAKSVEGFHSAYDGAQDHDFIFRCSEGLSRNVILHIPQALYHWRSTPSSTAENPEAKMYAYEAGKKAIRDHFKRIGLTAEVKNTIHLGFFDFTIKKSSKLSEAGIKIISKKEYEGLSEQEMQGIEEDYVLILAEDIRPETQDCMDIMLADMEFDDIGAVTGRIIGKNGRLESAGYDKIKDSVFEARFSGLNRHYSGYLHRAQIKQRVDGFSADCVLLRKEAVTSWYPQIEISNRYDVFFEPKAEFKRK